MSNRTVASTLGSGQLDFIGESLSVTRDHLSLTLQPEFLAADASDHLLQTLIKATCWQQPKLKVYGKWHRSPRLVQFVGDQRLIYKYANALHSTQAWTPVLRKIKLQVEQFSGAKFNSVLLNHYRDGQDTMGWHADDEPELGQQPVIASLSIGAARDIHFKPKNGGELIRLNLSSGSLLLMQGNTQQYWLHHIPKRMRCLTPRINLTFRMIHPV